MISKRMAAILVAAAVGVAAVTLLAPGPATVPSRSSRLRMPVSTPPRVLQLLDRSCADCHSDETRWPWYSSVPLVSWMVARHVREGRRYLNLSRFDSRTSRDQQDLLHAIAREVRTGGMPLGSYTLLHRDSRLSPADARDLGEWAQMERLRLAAVADVHEETR